jgi:lipase chaperone LimK
MLVLAVTALTLIPDEQEADRVFLKVTDRSSTSEKVKIKTTLAIKDNKQADENLYEGSSDVPVTVSTPKILPHMFAESLEGTEIDGQLKVDASGNLVVDLEVKDFFDYFLNTVGEVSPEVAVFEMQQLAASHLPPEAVNQAMKILGDYLAYKEQALQLMSQPMIPKEQQTATYQLDMLEHTFQTMKSLRRETMSPEAVEAFFAMEEAYGEFTLSSIRVQSDDSITDNKKTALLSHLRETLPPAIRQTEDHVVADAEKHLVIHQAISSGDEESLKQQLADNEYSEEAAAEIVAYQNQQQAFDQRYENYLAEKRQLLGAGLSDQDQTEQLSILRSQYFSNDRELTQAKVRDLRS